MGHRKDRRDIARAGQIHSTNYRSTLITVSPDTKATAGLVPTKPGTISALQYELLAKAPYKYTSDDVIFLVHARRTDTTPTQEARAAFFSTPQACLRGSPLARSHGFGILHDESGRIELVPIETKKYARLVNDPTIKKVPAMRKSRPSS